MANPFQWLTFGQAKSELALRLGDENMVFWSDAELGEYSDGRQIDFGRSLVADSISRFVYTIYSACV